MRYTYIFIISLMLSCLDVMAQEQLLFHSVDEQNGLASDQTSCLALDDYGYLWVGTTSALCRYDGRDFKLYSSSPENRTNVVTGNAIAHIAKDLDGNMWFATEKGVSYFNIKTNIFTHLPLHDNVSGNMVNIYQADKVFVNSKNEIFTFNPINLLCQYDAQKKCMEPVFLGIFGSKIPKYCCIDHSDHFWFLDEDEGVIYRVSPKGEIVLQINCQKYKMVNITKNHFGFLDNDNGEYWFGGNYGVHIWDMNTMSFKKIDAKNSEIFPDKDIKCIFKDSRGIIWMGTNALETFFYNPETKLYTCVPHAKSRTPYKLNSPTTIDICEDKRGLLWFGTWKGLSFTELNPTKQFHNISNDNKIIDERNYLSSFDSYNNLVAFGCDGGGITFWEKDAALPIVHIDPAESADSKMESGSVLAIAFDHEGYCYNGGYNRSVTRIHPNLKDIDVYKVDTTNSQKLQHDFTASIICDSKDRIWILSNGGGLCEVVDKEKGLMKYHNTDSKGNPHSGNCGTTLYEYAEDTLLVGSYIGFSVYDVKNDVFTTYGSIAEDSTTLSHNWVQTFCVDRKKRVWVGTGSGLNKFDIKTGKFVRYGREQGLQNEVIRGILEDSKSGMLWISTACGITKFDPDKGEAVRTYMVSDGLLAENFQVRAVHKMADGTMFFGVPNGFTYFLPEEVKDAQTISMPTITGMLINYNRIQPHDSLSPLRKAPEAIDYIVLDSDQRTFTIEFTSLNFINEGGIYYSYFLEGFNKRWVDIGKRHEVTFTNLDPGKYTFMVKCVSSDGVTSDIRPLKIIIRPPFYRTWWFISLLILLFSTLIVFYYLVHTRVLRERQQMLEKTVKERTEDLLTANKALEYQKEEIEKSLNSTLILNDLSRQISSSFDMSNIINIAFNHVKMMTNLDFFALGTYSQSKNNLEFNNIKYGQLENEPVVININDNNAETTCFLTSEDRYLTDDECDASAFRNIEGERFGTMFILPIHEASHINGVLVLGCHQSNMYSKTDRANLRMITSYLSIALEKSKDYHQIRIKNNAINGSIRYAKTIQDAILVHEDYLNKFFNAMIIFRPKDIVSGDFYWFKTIGNPEKPNMIFAAVIDCTGHGVPGAFMSLISNILLNDIIIRNHNYEPNQILSSLHKEIVLALNQSQNLNDDGLDMALCRFDLDTDGKTISKITYAGAKNSLYHYHSNTEEMEIHPADRLSIGGSNNLSEKIFTQLEIEAHKGDLFFMTSDGIIDQNNKERKRFGRKRLVEIIQKYHHLSMEEQKKQLEQALDSFMNGEEQRDDISVMGLKI